MSLAPATYPLEQLAPSEPPPAPGSPQELLAEALADAEVIRERAQLEGAAQGREAGMEDVRAAVQALNGATAELGRIADELAGVVERDAVELALALAGKILAGAIEARPELVLDAVAGALRRVVERRHVAVVVDPQDFELISGGIEQLQARLGGIETCDVQADRRIGRGGVIVRTVECEIDATVATQLERAREVILAELGGGPERT